MVYAPALVVSFVRHWVSNPEPFPYEGSAPPIELRSRNTVTIIVMFGVQFLRRILTVLPAHRVQ